MNTDAVPQNLGPYKIESQLGKGGFATVYKATVPDSGRLVAIKVLLPQYAENARIVRALEREVRRLVGLAHENLVSAIGFEVLDGRYAMVMEYIQGPTLTWTLYPDQEEQQQSDLTQFYGDAADGTILATSQTTHLRAHPPTIAEIVNITSGVASALEYVHQHGIYHLDIKPDNVLIARNRALLTDFGIAQALEDETNGLRGAGTPTYSSPEQARGDPVDGRSDIYSLGIVLYQMLTGQVPFVGETTRAILQQQQTATPVLPSQQRSDMPRGLEPILMRCLEKKPEKRYQTATELKDALRGVVKETTRPSRLYDLWLDQVGGGADARCSLCGASRRSLDEECAQCATRRAAGVCSMCGLVWQTPRTNAPCPVCGFSWAPKAAEMESKRLLEESRSFVAKLAEEASHADILRAYVFKHDLLPGLNEKGAAAQALAAAALKSGSVAPPGLIDVTSPQRVLAAMKALLNMAHLWESAALDRFIAAQDLEVLRRRRVAELAAGAERLRGLYFSLQAAGAADPEKTRSGYETAKKWHLQSARSYELAKMPEEAGAAAFSARLVERILAFADEPASAESRHTWSRSNEIAKSCVQGTAADVRVWDEYDGLRTRVADTIKGAHTRAMQALTSAKNVLGARDERLVSQRDLARREGERVAQVNADAASTYRADLGRFGRLGLLGRIAVCLGPLLLAALAGGLTFGTATSVAKWLAALAAAPMLSLPAAWTYLHQRRAQPFGARKVDVFPLVAGIASSWLALLVVMTFFGIPEAIPFLATERQALINAGIGWGVLAAVWFLELRLADSAERGRLSRLYQWVLYAVTAVLVASYAVALANWLPLASWWLTIGALTALLLGFLGGRSMAAIANAEAIARERQLATLIALEKSAANTFKKVDDDQKRTIEDARANATAILREAETATSVLEEAVRQFSIRRLGKRDADYFDAARPLHTSISTLKSQSVNPDSLVLTDIARYTHDANLAAKNARSAVEADYQRAATAPSVTRSRGWLLFSGVLTLVVLLIWGLLSMALIVPRTSIASALEPGIRRIQSQPPAAAVVHKPGLAVGTPAPVRTVQAILTGLPGIPTLVANGKATSGLDDTATSASALATVRASNASSTLTPTARPTLKAATGNTVVPTGTPLAQVNVNKANVRQGPGTNYKAVGGVAKGAKLEIVGRNSASNWWLVCCVNKQQVWIANSVVRITGSIDRVPVTTPAVNP